MSDMFTPPPPPPPPANTTCLPTLTGYPGLTLTHQVLQVQVQKALLLPINHQWGTKMLFWNHFLIKCRSKKIQNKKRKCVKIRTHSQNIEVWCFCWDLINIPPNIFSQKMLKSITYHWNSQDNLDMHWSVIQNPYNYILSNILVFWYFLR